MKSELVVAPEQNMTLERLKGLYDLIARMNSVYDLQELLEYVMDKALSLTGGHRGVLLLNNDQEPPLQDVAVIQGEALPKKDLDHILDFVSATVIKDVLDRGEPRLVSDLQTDKRYEGITSSDTRQFKKIRSVLAVPLKTAERLVGLIYIDHPKKGIFGQGDLDFLHAFANQAALAINRAREHHLQIKELTLLNELSRSVVQVLDLNEVLTRIAFEVTRMLKAESSSVLLLDEATGELAFATSVSNGQQLHIETRLNKKQGIAGWVMTHGQPVCINDVSQDARWFGEVETGFVTQSLLCVPLKINGRVLGVLEVLNKKHGQRFKPGDITLMSAFAASATIAIENARLFQEARQARQLRALTEVAITLSSTRDFNQVLDEGLEQALHTLKAEAGVISLVDNEQQTTVLSVQLSDRVSDQPATANRQLEALNSVSTWMLEASLNQALLDDVMIADESHPPDEANIVNLLASGIDALALAPIRVNDTINGHLAMIKLSPHTFSLEEVNLLNGLARIIGLAAQNAIHYFQTQAQTKRLAYLNEIGSALTRSLNLDQVLKVIIEGVNILLQTELTSVFLIDEETNELVLRYSTRGDTEIRLPPPWQGIAGWVARHDQPALVNNTQSDPRHLRQVAIETGYEAHSILCVPLKVEGQMIGVVEVLNRIGGQQFTHYHQSLLVELTKWAAIALHNARLFDERIQAYERLNAEQQRRVAAETRGAMAAIILDMAHTMNNVIGAIRVWGTMLENSVNSMPQAPIAKFSKAIGQIKQNAEEALALMSTMTGPLELAQTAPTDLHHCLDMAAESCWYPENIELIKDYGQNLPPVKANAERLEAVFHNLISNAVQAMTPHGGQIRLRTRQSKAGGAKITVADTGPGIPPELQDRVFDPGISGKEKGLGIGLWLVETFIYQFGGHIDFDSSAETGTQFRVILQPAGNNNSEN